MSFTINIAFVVKTLWYTANIAEACVIIFYEITLVTDTTVKITGQYNMALIFKTFNMFFQYLE